MEPRPLDHRIEDVKKWHVDWLVTRAESNGRARQEYSLHYRGKRPPGLRSIPGLTWLANLAQNN
jgi:hypothetical protein